MPKVLTVDGKDIQIGAFMFSDRKRPMICKQEGNTIVSYGTFRSVEAANEFMDALGTLVGAKFENGGSEK